ncbi:hypothetical protein IMCC3317_31990 [Kordia antarctica]|uniref:Uncharacterized protein n=1 Tax=Kordia antarctica TaxID=1218801 RepID=A0A7L4ZNP3_9FLAO|nr:hypothetical protein IMCC3317_31990 [Kordia antarctica]
METETEIEIEFENVTSSAVEMLFCEFCNIEYRIRNIEF